MNIQYVYLCHRCQDKVYRYQRTHDAVYCAKCESAGEDDVCGY